MKRMLCITLVLAMLLSVLSLGTLTASAAYSGTWGNLTWTLDDEGTLTISGEGEMDLLSPWVGDAWHPYADSIKTAVIEKGVTTIGKWAFSLCDALESVTIPDSVTTISDEAFYSCTALASVTIPDSVTFIGNEVFSSCHALKSIEVNSGNTEYSDVDGVLCSKDKTILIQYPAGKKDASYTIPDGVTTIGNFAFTYCAALEGVTIPDSVTTVDYFAFAYCTALESVTIGDSVTTIDDYAFYSCDSLDSVTIGNSVTTVDYFAFAYCSALKDLTIPDSVTTIDDYAFYGCKALETVYYGGSKESWDEIDLSDGGNDDLLNANIIFNCASDKTETMKGDVNGDEYVDNTDALIILKYDAGIIDLRGEECAVADVNSDGYADNTDALMILKYDAGIIDEL